MNTNRAFCISLLIAMGAAPAALAKTSTTTSAPADDTGAGHTYVQPLPHARTLADNVVVQPNPAPGTIVETPPTTTVPPPVVEPRTTRREVIHTDATPPRSYMGTIAVSAIMGGVTGVLIGGAIYYLGSQTHPYNIAYWAAGGVLVGTGVGLTQILIQESRASQATAFQDPAPTYRLALFNKRF